MNKEEILKSIFSDDSFGILDTKSDNNTVRTESDRELECFYEIEAFMKEYGREPKQNIQDMHEFKLASRLVGFRENPNSLHENGVQDSFNLLPIKEKKKIESITDIFADDAFSILSDDDNSLFDLKHVPEKSTRMESDFVARRKPCKDFAKYADLLKDVQNDLANGNRTLVSFKEDNLIEGNYYVHNGVLFLLEKIDITSKEQSFKSGGRTRKDGRTRCIFENGTESNMLYRSVAKVLYANGQVVTKTNKESVEKAYKTFGVIQEEDQTTGYIYVLKSKSIDPQITAIKNLYKIGYSTIDIAERIKNAENEPTYLMAKVESVAEWQCYNMNTQKLEGLLHRIFGNSCLEFDIFDKTGKRHTPREWFIAPLNIIEEAIMLIINGEIVNYRYDIDDEILISK